MGSVSTAERNVLIIHGELARTVRSTIADSGHQTLHILRIRSATTPAYWAPPKLGVARLVTDLSGTAEVGMRFTGMPASEFRRILDA